MFKMECARVHSIFGRREERMSEKMKIFQKIQYVTVGIAFASIVLPLIFWKKIPEKIPQHTMKWETWIFGQTRHL